MSAESHPPRLTEAERRQLDELERQLVGQFPDLDSRMASGPAADPHELRIARIVFAVIAVALVVVGGVFGGLGGAAAVLVAVAGTAGLVALTARNLRRATAAVDATVERGTDPAEA